MHHVLFIGHPCYTVAGLLAGLLQEILGSVQEIWGSVKVTCPVGNVDSNAHLYVKVSLFCMAYPFRNYALTNFLLLCASFFMT